MINAGERFLSAHINTGDDLGEVTESSSYCFQGSTIGVGALFRRCWVVDILLWVINHQWNGWNWKKENLGWWLLLSRQYTYCMNPYLRGKQEEMFSSRRKQLMLLGMNMLIYFASNMISRNYMKLLELDNVVDEELFTMATLPVGHAWMNTDLEAAAAASESSCVVLESNGEPEGRNTAARGALVFFFCCIFFSVGYKLSTGANLFSFFFINNSSCWSCLDEHSSCYKEKNEEKGR
ncbi:putative cleavage and polyadenylation specificity factor subunit 1 isoform X3 [Iris pallida]|uniref:Cleavage and polyadenylation specificity factor subunit 1 isoform X3 n=1 Tax=Iris pallida TaxID=29817 RepID=A0AAX6IL96_IRIPA|nr:putative cleavage and polyadenylation specificity factor subunit 1 isoform X3 [Iris pallida]